MIVLVRFALAVMCLAATSLALAAPVPTPTANRDSGATIAVTDLLAQVRTALSLAGQQLDAAKAPPLKSVTLALQTVAKSDKHGKIVFFIFQFGESTTTTSTSTMTVSLSKPGAEKERTLASVSPLASALANAIEAGWAAEKAARGAIEGLSPTSVSCAISFGVAREGTDGLTLALAPISVDAGRTTSIQTVQTITVTFGP
jgi:hypothetical protein